MRAIASAIVCFPVFTAADASSEPREYSFEIERQPLGSALQEFAKQSGVQVIFFSRVTDGHEAPAVKGRYTAPAALMRILDDSQLTFRELNPRTIEVQPLAAPNAHVEAAPNLPDALGMSHFTAIDSTTVSVVQNEQESEGGTETVKRVASHNARDDVAGLPEILVKGSNSLNVDIQRTEDDPQPYVVFNAEEIAQSGAFNLEEFLKARLPMNTAQGSPLQDVGGVFGNQSAINLRGLGTDNTLILINGRRAPRTSDIIRFGEFNQPDLNGIPLAAVERIEVLSATASGIYGGGATGGVVNVILRRNYRGVEVSGTYGNTFDSSFEDYILDLNGGFSLENGATHITFSGSYASGGNLRTGERDFAERSRALYYSNLPEQLLGFPPVGATTNLINTAGLTFGDVPTADELILDDGTPIGSWVTSVPVDYAGPTTDGGGGLAANAGRYNLDIPRGLWGRDASLMNSPEVESFGLTVRREFGVFVDAFLEATSSSNTSIGEIAFSLPNLITLPADAPNNPFTTDVIAQIPIIGPGGRTSASAEAESVTGGLVLSLPRAWTAGLDYSWSRSTTERNSAVFSVDYLALESAFLNGTLDILRDVNAFPIDYSPYAFAGTDPNDQWGPTEIDLASANLRISGPIAQLPGGSLVLSALYEHRGEDVNATFTRSPSFSGGAPTYFYYAPRSQVVDSAYLEVLAPLVTINNARTGVRLFELQASVRRDEYETTSVGFPVSVPSPDGPVPAVDESTNKAASTDHTLGLRYSPIEGLMLRASYGTGFLPPSIGQIVPFVVEGNFVAGIDPRRGNEFALYGPIPETAGGNTDLIPEESTSWSVGAIVTPKALPRLRISIDYTTIDKKNEIVALTTQQIWDREDLLPGRVTRGPLTPEDEALGYTAGPVIAMDSSLINLAATRVRALDMQLNYSLETGGFGTFDVYAVATWQKTLEQRLFSQEPFVNTAGFSEGPLKLRGNIGLNWQRGPWSAGWNVQYYDSYRVYPATSDPVTIDFLVSSQGSATIPSQNYHDVFARYDFGESGKTLLDGVEVILSVRNVFDELPPIIASNGPFGAYSTYGDPQLRRYSLSLRKSFR